MSLAAGVCEVQEQLEAAERDARALIEGLAEQHAQIRPTPQSWSVSECLHHLAISNRAYLAAMEPSVQKARSGTRKSGKVQLVRPGRIGAWFVAKLEPPPKIRIKAPAVIRPQSAMPLAEAFAGFLEQQQLVTAFLRTNRDLDLTRILYANPFVRGLRFSVATGLHIIAAHERRHLWQAWQARRAAESAVP